MASAIDLDRDLCLDAGKVEDVAEHRMLASELEAMQLPTPES
ncbi:MAG TPA: hypothetical protein VNI20_08015 [Fimbriimonadaceae bacterium]|nr:hypothetical protein [Fimbriimonadaceae bacterium]